MRKDELDALVSSISRNYDESDEIFFAKPGRHFPRRSAIIKMIKDIRVVMFPGYFGDEGISGSSPEYFIGDTLARINNTLRIQLREAFLFRDGDTLSEKEIEELVDVTATDFMNKLPEIQNTLMKDVQAAFDGDPAAESKEEIILTYPGTFAIFVHRLAHELYVHKVPLIPRLMSEYAHSNTGVDINAGAEIGEYFFIDHATGVVIGETTKIGKHVKVYQGVTLGALSTRKGQLLSGVKRHPTIEDNVTIYSNASVLGGETVVGEGSIIGGGAFVTESVPKNARVSNKVEVSVKESKPRPEASFETLS